MNIVVELLIVWRWQGGELLVRVGREVMRVVRTVFHKRSVRVVRPDETSQRWNLPDSRARNSQQQVVEVGNAINHDTPFRVVLSRAIEDSVCAMQRSSEGGQLRSDSGVR